MAAPDQRTEPVWRFFLHRRGRPHMTVRDPGSEALTLQGPAAQPGHVGGGPRLVDEGEAGRIEIELAVEPLFPSAQNVRAVLLGRVGVFF